MKYALLTILISFGWILKAQSDRSEVSQQEAEEREALQRRREAMMRLYENDPQRFMDSVKTVRERERYEEAIKRLNRYEQNKRLDTLKVIDLSYAQLQKIPEFVFSAANAEKLILDYNQVSKLPGKLKELDKLTSISWNYNQSVKGNRIGKNRNIEKLTMTNNQLVKVPSIQRLKSLKYLELSDNKLTDLSIKKMSKLDVLQELIIKNNPIGTLGEDKYYKLETVSVLKLNKCQIDSVHPSFYQMPQLAELQLQENPITGLPNGISNLKKLSKISFYKCSLSVLPEDFFDLPELIIADLYYNQLDKISPSIDHAKKIEVLFLSHNKIFDLPEELGNLSNLQELYLHNNRLSYLPTQISNLSKLRVLRINNNLLQNFPRQILQLRQLTDLDLDDNMIETVPAEIDQLKQLKLFTYDGNPINFNDQNNKAFMQSVATMIQKGTICKPAINMDYVDESGDSINVNN